MPWNGSVLITISVIGTIKSAYGDVRLVTGWERADLIGRTLTDIIPEQYRDRHRAGMERFMRNPSEDHPVFSARLAVSVLGPDGTERPIRLRVYGYDPRFGRVYAIMMRDGSES